MEKLKHSVVKYTALAAFTIASFSLGASKYHYDQLDANIQTTETYNHIQRQLGKVNYALAQPLLKPDRQQTLEDIKEAYQELKDDIYADYGVYDKNSLEEAIHQRTAEHDEKFIYGIGIFGFATMMGLGTLSHARRKQENNNE